MSKTVNIDGREYPVRVYPSRKRGKVVRRQAPPRDYRTTWNTGLSPQENINIMDGDFTPKDRQEFYR